MYVHRKQNRSIAILLAFMLLWGTLFTGVAAAADGGETGAENQAPGQADGIAVPSADTPPADEPSSEQIPSLSSDEPGLSAAAAESAQTMLIEDFEDMTDLFTSEIRTVPGSTKLEKQTRPSPVMYGHASGKLTYNFTGTIGTSAAYLNFSSKTLSGYPTKIGAWVYGDAGKHWLRAQFEDGSGAKHVSDFTTTTGFNWSGWKYVTVNVPQGKPAPLKLTQIYITELNNDNKTSGAVYFDQVSAIYSDQSPVSVELSGLRGMKPGESLQAKALATVVGGTALTDVTASTSFSSSAPEVASVSATGLVEAAGLGTTTITAANGNLQATYLLTVSETGAAPTGIELEGSTVLEIGNTETVRAFAFYEGNTEAVPAGQDVAFASSNSAVATVDSAGNLAAVGAGSTVISAAWNGQAASYTLTVNEPVPVLQSIRIAGLQPMTEGESAQASVFAAYSILTEEVDVTDEAVFASSNPEVAEISEEGLVTAKMRGTTRIEAQFENKTVRLLLIVNTSQEPLKRELRAAWIASVENIDWPAKGVTTEAEQKQDFIELLDELAATGINAVIVQVKPTADAFYPSELAPWSEWLTGEQGKDPGYDPLAFMLEEAHKRNMEFHAWFNPYRISMHADLNKLVDDHPAKLHPDWVESYGGKLYFNPGVPEAKQYVIDSVMEVVDHYDIDAVHFDDYFYPYPVTGEEFPDDAEYTAYGSAFANKAAWRRNNVDTLIEGLSDAIKASKPYVKFGISPFGIWRNKSTDSAGSDTNGLQSYDALNADTKGWVEKGWLDYIAPQDYWHFNNGPAAYEKVLDWWRGVVEGRDVHLYVGQAIYRVPTWEDPQEFSNQIVYNRSYPETVRGSMLFSAKDVIANYLGTQDQLMQELYRYPALPPTMPWLDNEAPEAPALLSALSAKSGQVELRFEDAPESDAAYYAVYRQEGDSAPDTTDPSKLIGKVRKQSGAAQQMYLDMNVQDGVTYTYVVTALDRLHNESGGSNAVASAYEAGDRLYEKIMAKDAVSGTIELERAGVKKLAANVTIEQKLGERVFPRLLQEVMVGAENAEIQLNENGEISKITLIGETERDTMRIGIRSSIADISDLTQLNHNSIELLSASPFRIVDKIGERNVTAAANLPVSITVTEGTITVAQDGKTLLTTTNRIYALPPANGGLIEVSSITRAQGKPKYRGQLEITAAENGGKLRLVNELSMEQYLYQVVPSEMPASFGLEALKAQAVAARTYALADYLSNRFAQYGFHVDDSTSSQVYNNTAENELTKQAVDATAGQVMVSGGMLVDARYYSTSGGYGASKHEVWADTGTNLFPGTAIPYLTAKSYTYSPDNNEQMLEIDTSNEDEINAFYKDLSLNGYDSDSLYFRWKVSLTAEELGKTVNKNIKLRYAAEPMFILTKQPDGSYASKPIPEAGIGELLGMSVAKRGAGGNITELLIEGTTGTYKIIKEYNIRFTIRPNKSDTGSGTDILAYRAKGGSSEYDPAATLKNPSILYSAFFTFDLAKNGEGDIESVTFYGGGNGHGVGMSQYGAQMLGKSGKTFADILNAYYTGMNIVSLNSPIMTSLETAAPIKLQTGATHKLKVYGIFSNGDKAEVTAGIGYQSSDSAIVSVDADGNLKALKAGTAEMTITVGALSTRVTVTAYNAPVYPPPPGNNSGNPGEKPEEEPGHPVINFTDIVNHWAKAAIERAVELGIVLGYEDGTFRPEAKVTRAQFVTLLMRAFPVETNKANVKPLFADHDSIPDWALDAVMQAAAAGYIQGYEDGSFRPDEPISRSEITALIVRFAGLEPIEDAELAFEDGDSAPAWARGYIAAAVEAGLIQGKGNNRFGPNDDSKRAEAVVLLLALLDSAEE
ncbi:SpoIID/LytB domain-containing protein [Paenibacillus nanensis]|uniref:SpoIID/LytB domain-containing protein n=1 Tax=Paenibacillus nanensis TaxID=393251 RepID=A0A3A1V2B7_9BACL|nr:family 10 glycosylhydrolase [Paenibacillus nanensis]RIX53971.1 SpoIID/LytB domain-containing protein [Paenibacillus nanensis]